MFHLTREEVTPKVHIPKKTHRSLDSHKDFLAYQHALMKVARATGQNIDPLVTKLSTSLAAYQMMGIDESVSRLQEAMQDLNHAIDEHDGET